MNKTDTADWSRLRRLTTGFWVLAAGVGLIAFAGGRALAQAPNTPQITDFQPKSGPVGTEVTITGSNLGEATAVQFNGVNASFRVGFSGDTIVATVPGGPSSGAIQVITPVGTAASAGSFTVTATPPPEITNFAPESGAAGAQVTVSGRNFTQTTAVRFNGVEADFTLFGDTIAASVPPGATTGPITVVTPGGSATSAKAFVVTVEGAPVISDITPLRGRPGTRVTISGQNLETAALVRFGGATASFSVFGSSIFATVPDDAASGPITVVTSKGTATSASAFSVLDPLTPEITNLNPDRGAEGTPVTVTGTNFVNVTEVRLGGISVPFTLVSSSELTVTVPEGATTGPIVVTNPAGSAVSSQSFLVAPKVLSFEPTHGAPGTAVVIRGLNLSGAFAVLFGGIGATFAAVSANELRAVVPEGASSGSITVATPGGFSSSDGNFLLPPVILDFDPPSGLPGSTVTILGDNLLGATAVSFGGLSASATPFSLTKISAIVPAGAQNGPVTVTTPAGTATSTNQFYIGLFSDVALSVTASPDLVGLGDLLSYTITVRNRGPLQASDVVLTDRLPPEVDLIFTPSGANCIQTNHMIICNLGTLQSGQAVDVNVSTVILDGPYLVNSAQVTQTSSDSYLSNNSSTLRTVLKGAPPPTDVALTVSFTGPQLELAWPAAAGDFILESTGSLVSPANWTPVPDAPVLDGANKRLRVSAPSGTKFFRLRLR